MVVRSGVSPSCVTINLLIQYLIQSYSMPSQNKDTVLETVSLFKYIKSSVCDNFKTVSPMSTLKQMQPQETNYASNNQKQDSAKLMYGCT